MIQVNNHLALVTHQPPLFVSHSYSKNRTVNRQMLVLSSVFNYLSCDNRECASDLILTVEMSQLMSLCQDYVTGIILNADTPQNKNTNNDLGLDTEIVKSDVMAADEDADSSLMR